MKVVRAPMLERYTDEQIAIFALKGLVAELDGVLYPTISGEVAVPVWRLSGGAANTNPLLSLGGIMSTTTLAGATIFDDVTGDESATGDTEYRGVYVLNNGATDLISAFVWIQTNTPSVDDTISIALAGAGANATMATIPNENTAPSDGASFSAPSNKGTGLSIGTLAAGQRYGVWIKRVVTAGAAAYNSDGFTLRVEGDTGA